MHKRILREAISYYTTIAVKATDVNQNTKKSTIQTCTLDNYVYYELNVQTDKCFIKRFVSCFCRWKKTSARYY